MDLGIAGKVAVVAASSKGLGYASALELARNGCRVVVSGRTESSLRVAAERISALAGVPIDSVVCDVGTPEGCRSLVEGAVSAFGGVDILVTNTGGPEAGAFESLGDDAWARAIDVTLLNVVRLIRAALPSMKLRNWGRIVNITSLSARQPIDGLLLSNALRPAVHGLAKTLSRELAPHGILVNNVCPGMHATERLDHLADVRAKAGGTTREQELARMASLIPLRRLGDPAELAAAVAFLCSARASFITGQSIIVDGGSSAFLN